MSDPPSKFVKSLTSDRFEFTVAQSTHWLLKVIYEFWAHVINGDDDPLLSGSGFATSGGLNLPANFTSGSTLLAVGTDGVTSFGNNSFYSPSTNFLTLNPSGSLLGKYIVLWKSGSQSFDDGIYRISYVESANRLIVDTTTAGTPRRGNKSTFWTRDQIRFRIVDIDLAATLAGWTTGHGMTLQFNAAGDVNRGQRSSQFHFHLDSTQTYLTSMSISPSGSWNGGDFVDSGSKINISIFAPVGGSPGEFVTSLAGGKDYLSCHVKALDGTLQSIVSGSGFHVEIPARMYPSEYDPNPITFMAYAGVAVSQTTGSYSTGFRMVGADGVLRTWTTLVRSPFGDRTNTAFSALGNGIFNGLANPSFASNSTYNSYENRFLMSDAVLHLPTTNQFSLARVRLRRVRFSRPRGDGQRPGNKFGDRWVEFDLGILLPWDNTIMPFGKLPWEGL